MSQEDEKPWNEEQWEKFMKQQDLKSARFGEILETVLDDPNRDEIIEKEMGWKFHDGPGIEVPDLTPQEEEEINQQIKEEDEALHRIPAYQKSMEVATRVQRLLKPLFKNSEEDDPDDDITANQNCQKALKSIRDRKILPAQRVDEVLKHVEQAGKIIEQRIDEFRSKVWWDCG